MIPYHIRARLLQMEPSLDLNWQSLLSEVFAESDLDICEEIDRQILKPKEIYWNRVSNTFEYKVSNSLSVLKHSFSNERMRSIATKLSQSINWLTDITDSVKIADYIENALHQINQIPTEDNLKIQREKMLMRRVFLQDVAKLVRTLNIDPPKGIRNLTAQQIKSFIVEVFIKQQLLGYWFKPLLPKSAELMKHPFFKYWLLKEQVIRRFDIVKTSEFIFVVAPVNHFEHNPYSIRRFLYEDVLEYNQQIYLNGVVLDMSRYSEQGYIDNFTQQVEKIVTIQHQVHKDVIETVQEFEAIAEKKLIPMLAESLEMLGSNSDIVAKKHLKTFENILIGEILTPMRNTLKNDLSHIEEFEYLYVSIHRILSDILAHYLEFKEQPALFFNHTVQLFEYKLIAYLRLLEKRKDEIFIPLNAYEWKVMDDRSEQPLVNIQQELDRHVRDFREVINITENLRRNQVEVQGSFLKRMMKGDKIEKEIQQATVAGLRIKKQAYLDILTIPKTFKKYTVFIEFESFMATSELERHYAFPAGDNGLTRLPLLIRMPENLEDFDLEALNTAILPDLKLNPIS